MAKIIAVANQKGGVGKSTISVHLAHYAANVRGLRVLVVDFDQTKNTTSCFVNLDTYNGPTASVLFQENADWKPFVSSERIHVLPYDKVRMEHLPDEVQFFPREQFQRLGNEYDLIIIDTPPTEGHRMLASLIAADAVVSPFKMLQFDLDAYTAFQEVVQQVQAMYNPRLRHVGILANQFNNRSKSQRESLAEARELLGELVLPCVVSDRISIPDALALSLPVWDVKKRGESGRLASSELMKVCEEIFTRVMK